MWMVLASEEPSSSIAPLLLSTQRMFSGKYLPLEKNLLEKNQLSHKA